MTTSTIYKMHFMCFESYFRWVQITTSSIYSYEITYYYNLEKLRIATSGTRETEWLPANWTALY